MDEHLPEPETIEEEGDDYRVRFRDPDAFAELRSPAWANRTADEIAQGSTVRMGLRASGDEWVVQSVFVPKEGGKARARTRAREIVEAVDDRR